MLTKKAFHFFLKNEKVNNKIFVVAGGVAANNGIRKKLIQTGVENNFKVIFPEYNLCGDNAAMIGLVGLEKFKLEKFDKIDLEANPRQTLDINAKFLKGSGVNF